MVLSFFVNFTALPGIAAVFGFEIPQTNVVVSEEENHAGISALYEKALPRILNVHDFIKFDCLQKTSKKVFADHDRGHLSVFLSIFSPPPEV